MRSTLIGCAAVLLSAGPALAQTPSITGIFPPGGRAGATVQATVSGGSLANVQKILVSGSGVKVEKADGGSATACPIRLTIAEDAPAGLREVRIVTTTGGSNAGRIWVGRYPDAQEKEPNDDRAKPQLLESFPVTVHGRSDKAADVDIYSFHAAAGETWVFSINAARHYSDLDGYLALFDPRGVIVSYAMDSFGRDPRLIHTFKDAGRYTLRVRDSMYRGGGGYTYSLTAGKLPVVTSWSPMGGVPGRTVTLDLKGVNLGDMGEQQVKLPADCDGERFRFAPRTPNGPANPIELFLDEVPEVEDYEPNDAVNVGGAVVAHPLPLVASGRINEDGDRDLIRFELKEKQQVAVRVTARRIGSRLDAVLRLLDSEGKQLATNDDAAGGKDSRLTFTAPKAGQYLAEVRSLSTRGGDDYFYRLEVKAPAGPDFALTMTPDNPAAPPGGAVAVTVNARRAGYNGEIALRLENLPEGVTASPAVIRSGQNSVVFTLAAPAGAKPASAPLQVIGTAKIGERTVSRIAAGQEQYQPPLANANQKRIRDTEFVVAAVGAEPPYTLSLAAPKLEVKAGDKLELTVKAARKKDYKENIAVTVLGLPSSIKASALTINGDKTEGKITLTAAANTAAGAYPIIIQGNAKNVLVAVPATDLTATPAKKEPEKKEAAKKK
jgi:hypothetical protein